VKSLDLFHEFEPKRALTCDHCDVIERVAERRMRLAGSLKSTSYGRIEALTTFVNHCSVITTSVNLRERGPHWNEDFTWNACISSGKRKSLSMVSSGARHNTLLGTFAETRNLVGGPANFERASALKVLRLEKYW
jgi:hypothetical protein